MFALRFNSHDEAASSRYNRTSHGIDGRFDHAMTTNHAVSIDVADVSLPDAAIDATSATNLLVAGPPMTDKFTIMLELLVSVSDRSIVVTTKHPSLAVLGAYDTVTGEGKRGTIGVIDAVDTTKEGPDRRDVDLVRYVGSPGNLTRIGIEFSGLVDSLPPDDDRIGVGLHTVSPLIMHAGLQPVYRFLGELTARVRRGDHRSVVVLDTPVAEYDVDSLRHHFDAVIETRPDEAGGTELRVTGRRDAPADWTPY